MNTMPTGTSETIYGVVGMSAAYSFVAPSRLADLDRERMDVIDKLNSFYQFRMG